MIAVSSKCKELAFFSPWTQEVNSTHIRLSEMSWASPQRLMYIQFTCCVHGDGIFFFKNLEAGYSPAGK